MAPVVPNPARILEFASEAAFEAWLAQHHHSWPEVWVKIHKKGSDLPSVTPAQAIDVVLCWGWIDGIRKACDEESFLQRYTPRGPRSVWSQINREHVARLGAAGRMTPHGQRHVDAARADGRWDAAYAPMSSTSVASLPADLRAAIEANPRATRTLGGLDRLNLFALAYRTGAMKTPAGRARKIAALVETLARGEPIVPSRAVGARSSASSTASPTGQRSKAAVPVAVRAKPGAASSATRRPSAASSRPTARSKGKSSAPRPRKRPRRGPERR